MPQSVGFSSVSKATGCVQDERAVRLNFGIEYSYRRLGSLVLHILMSHSTSTARLLCYIRIDGQDLSKDTSSNVLGGDEKMRAGRTGSGFAGVNRSSDRRVMSEACLQAEKHGRTRQTDKASPQGERKDQTWTQG